MSGVNRSKLPVILVTGAMGTVGMHFCRTILDRNQGNLVAVGRTKAHISGYAQPVLAKDIGPNTVWRDVIKGVDIVVHLAAIVHRMKDSASAEEHVRVNIDGTRKLLSAAIEAGVKRFVFVSTVKVMGEKSEGDSVLDEKAKANPADDYSRSKYEAERIVRRMCQEGAMNYVIVRPTMVYGPGDKGNFGRMCRLVASGIPLPFGSVRNSRSMVSIDNLCDLLLLACFRDHARNEVFCAADCDGVSTVQLVRGIARASGRHALILPFPVAILRILARIFRRGSEVRRLTESFRVDASKARRLLGWEPRSMESELERYLNQR